MKKTIIASSLSLFLFAGCASNTALSQKDIMEKFPTVNEARLLLEKANNENIEYYSPKTMETAQSVFDNALKEAKAGKASASSSAASAITAVNAAIKQSEEAKYALEEVFVARKKALAVNANNLVPEKFETAEKQLKKMLSLLEDGEDDRAKRDISSLKSQYLAIELAALKTNMLGVADKTIKSAMAKDLDDVTPLLIAQAKSEYQLALDTLEVNRTDTEKANVHSNKAIWLVKRAEGVAEINQYFKNADFTEEQKIVWFQEQLGLAFSPLNSELPFNQPNKEVVNGAKDSLSQMLATNQTLSFNVSELKDRLESLQHMSKSRETQLSRDKEEMILLAKKDEARFNDIQALFNEEEATVYRQVNNVLIRAQGFSFKTGGSEIESTNFVLLNKIIDAVNRFPKANIVVSGHTDSTGSNDLNLQLSQDRAKTVANFMTQVGNIDSSRIQFKGFGKNKPVASNETVEGRAQNRRVEILIIN